MHHCLEFLQCFIICGIFLFIYTECICAEIVYCDNTSSLLSIILRAQNNGKEIKLRMPLL